ncbi:SulA-like leucine-rich domain-containing protein [Bacterioplanoides sp.]|uniref:SulA-like leucine-rich domain-containing protein n=1 Tax=Bacterioplanoides sp. TaxID=2066072 RepID=UPI003B00DD22
MRQLTLGMEPLGMEQGGLTLSSTTLRSPQVNSGSLTEMILTEGSAIQPMHLLPLLAQCSAQQRWLMWLSPEMPMNKHYLDSLGLQNSPVIHLDVCQDTQKTLIEKALEAANSHLIIEWQGKLEEAQRRDIEQRANLSGSHVIVIQRR